MLFDTFHILVYLGFITLVILLVITQRKRVTQADIIKVLQAESRGQRDEIAKGFRASREELHHTMQQLTQPLHSHMQNMMKNHHEHAESLQQKVEKGLRLMWQDAHQAGKEQRIELKESIKALQEAFAENIQSFSHLQQEKLALLAKQQGELVRNTEQKLEKMRETVDEKLHKTLEERLGQSFQLVSHRLEAVQKGLGEMQKLAHDVGDLKTVLSNVKTRGTLGEIQLGNILAEVMSPQQYASNVRTKPNGQERVEFAIKLPGKDATQSSIYLPIDAKFPQVALVKLQAAQEKGDKVTTEVATKELLQAIKKAAKDIQTKYIAPPHTTDFGIMFLPTESLFAEVLRHPDLIATIQRTYKVIITGPTTLAAMLNSLQMGFKTLAIQRRSSEVWEVLAAVKNEFAKFGGVLEKAQHKIQEANTQLDKLVGERTRVMMKKLKKIEHLPTGEETEKLGPS